VDVVRREAAHAAIRLPSVRRGNLPAWDPRAAAQCERSMEDPKASFDQIKSRRAVLEGYL